MLALPLTVLFAVCLSLSSGESIVRRVKRDADCGIETGTTSCTVNGETYETGSTFSAYGDCFVFQCNSGNANMIEEGCEQTDYEQAEDKCRDVGETWPSSTSPCFTQACTKETVNNTSTYRTVVESAGCEYPAGECKDNGATWEVNCVTYMCQIEQDGNSYKVSTPASSARCKDANGVCRSIGETWDVGCHSYTCTSSVVDGVTKLSTVPTYRCKDSSGTCRDIDSTWNVGCHIYTCKKTVVNGVMSLSQPATFRCTDQNGACRAIGSSWDIGCNTYTCSSTVNSSGQTSLSVSKTAIRCVDANGVCRNQGDTFPLSIGGKLYNNCHCTISGTSISYSCA